MLHYKVFYKKGMMEDFNKHVFATVRASNRTDALRQAFDNVPSARVWGAIVRIDAPAIIQVVQDASETAHVSFWQSGARAGMFSQKAYPVIDRTNTLVKVELMPGMPKWYPVAQVKAA